VTFYELSQYRAEEPIIIPDPWRIFICVCGAGTYMSSAPQRCGSCTSTHIEPAPLFYSPKKGEPYDEFMSRMLRGRRNGQNGHMLRRHAETDAVPA